MPSTVEQWVTWFLTAGKLALAGFIGWIGNWLWNRYWNVRDAQESSVMNALKAHHERIISLEVKEGEKQKAMGRMEGEINRLDGKLEGLQAFWRSRFEKLEEKIDARFEVMRTEIREGQTALQMGMVSALQAHQQRVHDRLNEATASQAMLLNEMFDKLVDRAGE